MNREILKCVFVLVAISVCSIFAATHVDGEKDARDLARFEADWLTANLNGDSRWSEQFGSGKLNILLANSKQLEQRRNSTLGILDPSVPDDARKVRISGTIIFLTSDVTKNRSFQFLDTFNRKAGKWEAIASSFSPDDATGPQSKERIENEIRKLDAAAAKAILEKDEAAVARFFTAESVTNDPRSGLTRGYSGVIQAMRTGSINYYSFERVVESVQVLGDTIVTMGSEIVVMKNASGGAGQSLRRRYTNVWMRTGPGWQIVSRHANVIQYSDKQ